MKTGKEKKKRKSRPGRIRRPNIKITGIPEEENRENGEEETVYKILKKSCRKQFPKWKNQELAIMDENTLKSRHIAEISDHRDLKKKDSWFSGEKQKNVKEENRIRTASDFS